MSTPTTFTPNSRQAWVSLASLCMLTAVVWISASDVLVALPGIASELGASMDTLSWAATGFTLAGAAVIVGGRLGDVFGRRNIVALGALIMLAGAVLSALAPGALLLIAGRVVSGLGAALILPASLATVVVMFTGRAQAKAISAWIVTCWAAQASGTLVGGALVEVASWRWVFWFNVPLLLIGLVWMWLSTPATSMANVPRRIDVLGAVLVVSSVALACYAMIAADSAPVYFTVGALLAAAALAAGFVFWQRRCTFPLVDLAIFTRRRFNGATFANLSVNVVFAGVLFLMALYLQNVGEFSPLEAGALLLPASVPILLANPLGVRLFERVGPAIPTALGMAVLALGVGWLFFVTPSYWSVLGPFLLIGAGVGLQIGPCAAAAVDDPGPAGEGVASGIFKASSMVGSAVGVAVVTMVFQMVAAKQFLAQFPTWTAQQVHTAVGELTGSGDPTALGPQVVSAVFDFAASYAVLPLVATCVLAGVLSYWALTPARSRSEQLSS